MSRSSATQLATALFLRSYGAAPTVGASAPGRVNLIGEHLDYNGGPVLPVAVQRRTAVVAAPADAWSFVSDIDGMVHLEPDGAALSGVWTDYLLGVVRELEALGAAPAGARVAVASTLPIGAGLSSSAALTVAAAQALSRVAGVRLTPEVLAEVAFRAEHDWVGVRCGRMDQTIAAHGRSGTAMLFDTTTGDRRHVPLPGRFWVVETGVAHRLTGGELNERRRECEEALAHCREWRPGLVALAEMSLDALPDFEDRLPPSLYRRLRHVVSEVARTHRAAAALTDGDPAGLGALLVEGHASLRLDYESSVPEADLLVDSAVRHGAYGARLTGAGWGGAVVMLAPAAEGRKLLRAIGRDFADRFGRRPQAWSSRAAAGVRVEPIH